MHAWKEELAEPAGIMLVIGTEIQRTFFQLPGYDTKFWTIYQKISGDVPQSGTNQSYIGGIAGVWKSNDEEEQPGQSTPLFDAKNLFDNEESGMFTSKLCVKGTNGDVCT